MQKERSAYIVCVLFSHQDFATRSLKMSEESLAALVADDTDTTDIQQYEMRRTWESRCVNLPDSVWCSGMTFYLNECYWTAKYAGAHALGISWMIC